MSEVYVGWGNDSDEDGSDAYSSSDDRDAVAPDPSSADDAFRQTYCKDTSLPSLTPSSTADADEGGHHLSEAEVADLTKWDGRVQRGVVYGREYEPTEEERAEMEELAKSLGVAPRGKRTSLASALRPQGNEPRSILLKRGLVTLCGDGSATNGAAEVDSPPPRHEKELILITNAIVVAPVTAATAQRDRAGGSSARNILATANELFQVPGLGNLPGLPRNQSGCGAKEFIALSSVLAVMDLAVCVSPTSLRVVDPLATEGECGPATKAAAASGDGEANGASCELDDEADGKSSSGDVDDDEPVDKDTAVDGEVSFRVVVADVDGAGNGGGRCSFTFVCPTRQHKEAWLHALDAAIVGSRLREGAADGEAREKGWEHKIVRATVYSAAVLGDVEMLHKIVSRSPEMSVCIPDQLGYTATHYAAMYGHNDCLAMLLGSGADPDGKDSDMMSPIDYASKRRDRKALELFEFNGGTLSTDDKEWIAPDSTEWSTKEGTKTEKSEKTKKGKKKLFGLKGKKKADETDSKAQKDEAFASNSYDAEDLPSESENAGPPDEGSKEASPKKEGKKTFGMLTSKARRRESADLEEKNLSEPDDEGAFPSEDERESSRMEGQDQKKANESRKKFGFSPMKKRSGKNKKPDDEKPAAMHDADGSLSDTGTDDLHSSVASHDSKKMKGGRKAFGLLSTKRDSGVRRGSKLEEISVELDEDVDGDADVDEVSLSELGEIFDDMEMHDTKDENEGKKSFGLFKKRHSNKNLKAESDASGLCADTKTSLFDTDSGDIPQDAGSKEKEKPNGEGKRFGLRLSNKARTATDDETERPPSPPANDELQYPAENSQDDVNKWESRVAREDVYCCDYMPSEEEEREVEELALLMIKKKSMQKKRSAMQSVLRPQEDEPRSIILKRGATSFEFGAKDASAKPRSNGMEEKELVLLTNAVVIAPPTLSPSTQLGEDMSPLSPSRKGKNILSATNKLMKKKNEKCMYLKSILAVMDLAVCSEASLKVDYVKENSDSDSEDDSEESDDDNSEEDIDNESAFRIVVESGSYTFRCSSATEKDSWLHALEVAIVEAHLRDVEAQELLDKGWNHKILRSTMYSAAICGDADMLHEIVSGLNKTQINAQDQQGYSALHYAAMKGNNGCLAVLLDAGAKPNAKDADKMSPVDYASKRRNRRALEMLKANGGRLSRDDKEWIESVARAAEGNAAKSPDRSASGAVSAMSEAMSQMNERGEKLNELHGKTANLMDAAANYKDFASQLKKKTKEESKLFGVL